MKIVCFVLTSAIVYLLTFNVLRDSNETAMELAACQMPETAHPVITYQEMTQKVACVKNVPQIPSVLRQDFNVFRGGQ